MNENQNYTGNECGVSLIKIANDLNVDVDTAVKCIGEMILNRIKTDEKDLHNDVEAATFWTTNYDDSTCIEFTFYGDTDGHWENDGIGAYEYWGSLGYDKGTDYIVIDRTSLDDVEDIKEYLPEFLKSNYGMEMSGDDDISSDQNDNIKMMKIYITLQLDYSTDDNKELFDKLIQDLKPYLNAAKKSNTKVKMYKTSR